MKLSYNKVFDRYTMSFSDKLAESSYSLYRTLRLQLAKIFPLSEHEKYWFDDDPFSKEEAADMPQGFDYIEKKDVDSFVKLDYIDLYDYLPKEDLPKFIKELKKCVRRNKITPFGAFRSREDIDKIDNFGRYYDGQAFTHILSVRFRKNEKLQQSCSDLSVSLRNLSATFLLVQYRVYITKEFNTKIAEVCKKKYSGYTTVYRQFNTPWYAVKKFGRSSHTGNNVRQEKIYKMISQLKWQILMEIELSDFAQENYSGLAVIKAFVKETKELMMFRRLNRENEDINVEYTKISTLLNIMVTLFVESVICVILGYGGYLVYCGSFDAGQLVEYIGYFSAVVWPIMAVSMLIEKTSRGKASLNRITELLDAKVDVKDRGGVQDLPFIHGKIEFRNLTFRYPDGEYDVLKNVSFTIEPGESVGIVGKTGSGKTTIVDLLLRTYNVPDGMLFIDDHDVNTVSIHSVREGCAYVPQDNFLFSDTISGNISFAFDDENQEAIEDAAMMSDVHDNIAEFKEGYRTVLGERGVTVSGGQKQRISIARALMKHAPILILDDSVSAVDTKTERTILDNLKKREGLTTILIAHRISTVEQMDKIVFVEDGEVHAVGKHEDLYRTCTAYRKMVDLQKLEEEAGEE